LGAPRPVERLPKRRYERGVIETLLELELPLEGSNEL
jgi:hypothetical protein